MCQMKEGPDQARAWAIALAGFVINGLLSGISRTTGLFYVALIRTYGVSRFEANLPFTVRNVVRNLSGPIVGAIGQRYGSRDVTIAGGVFASLGILLCAFANSILWITILWGGMHGFGVALGNTLFQVVVTQYFVKYRATASGLAISGACFGAFFLPVLLEYMLLNLGLSGTFLLTGGLIMHVLPAAIMIKEPPWIRRQEVDRMNQENSNVANKRNKPNNILSRIQEESNDYVEVEDSTKKIKDQNVVIKDQNVIIKDPIDFFTEIRQHQNGIDNPVYVGSWSDLNEKFSEKQPHEMESKEDIVLRSRLRTISVGEVSITIPIHSSDILQETSIYKALLLMCKNPMFHMISLSLAAFAMMFDPVITVIVDYLMDKGLTEDIAKYFIIMLAVGDLVGRLGFGWVTDKGYMSITKFMMLLQVLQGVVFLVIPFLYSFYGLMASMVLFGLTSGAILVIFPILVTRYLQSVQSLAMGSIQFFTGILSFAVPPIIGYFRDEIGSYDGMFFITGGLSVFAGFCWLLEPMLVKLQENRLKKQSEPTTTHP